MLATLRRLTYAYSAALALMAQSGRASQDAKAHNPVQDIYLRVVENGENKVIGVAAKALADSGVGCKMS